MFFALKILENMCLGLPLEYLLVSIEAAVRLFFAGGYFGFHFAGGEPLPG